MPINLKDALEKALPIVIRAGELVRESWSSEHQARHKGRIDLVTDTDAQVEAFLRRELAAILPDAAFLGEESAGNALEMLQAPLCWVVDPIDGTTNYVHHIPMVGVSAGLCANGEPILGIINAPMLGEIFSATSGGGAYLNGAPIHVSDTEDPVNALVATGFPYDFGDNLEGILARLRRVLPATQGLRRPGAASLDLAWVACGRLDAFFEDGLKPWDIAAGWLIVKEAGGELSTFNGDAAGFYTSMLATNGHLQQAMVELVRD